MWGVDINAARLPSANRLALVNHMVIKSRIDWDEVIARVDSVKNAEKVQCHTWSAIAEKMLETFITQKPSRGND